MNDGTYERFCELRDAAGLRNADVARATGIKPHTLSEWRHGQSRPNTEKLIKIANFFNTSVEYLVTGKNAETVVEDVREGMTGEKAEINGEEGITKMERERIRLAGVITRRPILYELVKMEEKLGNKELKILKGMVEMIGERYRDNGES